MYNKKMILYSVSIVLMMDYMGYGMLLSIAPQLFMNSESGLFMNSSMSTLWREILFSISLSLFSLMSVVGMPILCSLSDQYGRKKVLLFNICGFIINYLIGALAVLLHSFELFLFNRMCDGFLDGIYPLVDTIIGDISENEEERVSSFKLLGITSTTGMVLGPLLAIIVYKVDLTNPVVLAFLCSALLGAFGLCFSIYGLRGMPPHRPIILHNHSFLHRFNIFNGLRYLFSRIHVKFISVAYFLFQFGSGLVFQGLGLYLTIKYDYTSLELGKFMLIMCVITIIGMNLLPKLFSRVLGYKTQMIALLLFTSGLLLVEFWVKNFVALVAYRQWVVTAYAVWVVAGIFYAIQPSINSIFNSFLSSTVSYPRRGMVLGGFGQIFSLAWGLSALTVGIMIEYKLVLLFAGILFGCCCFLMLCHFQLHSRRRLNKKQPAT
ncbi:MAG: hypothetical protein QG673_983 [Pseudomonadota bacterium]|nr:hypothetical protein [Pseudomonadota bacterium]